MFLALALWLSCLIGVFAQPAPLQFSDCFAGSSTDRKLDVSSIYAQVIPDAFGKAHLNLTLFGETPQLIQEASNGSDPVASESRCGCPRGPY